MDIARIGIFALGGALLAGGAYWLGSYSNQGHDNRPEAPSLNQADFDNAPDPQAPQPSPVRESAAVTLNPQHLAGSWILSPKGGEDGRTDCGDYSSASIYRLNRNTAKIMTFRANGEYRDMFAYTTPSGEEHYTLGTAQWSVENDNIVLNASVSEDAFINESDEPIRLKAHLMEQNVLRLDVDGDVGRYVRCVGDTREIYNE